MLWLLGGAAIPPYRLNSEPEQQIVGSASNLVLFVVAVVILHLLACVSSKFN